MPLGANSNSGVSDIGQAREDEKRYRPGMDLVRAEISHVELLERRHRHPESVPRRGFRRGHSPKTNKTP